MGIFTRKQICRYNAEFNIQFQICYVLMRFFVKDVDYTVGYMNNKEEGKATVEFAMHTYYNE